MIHGCYAANGSLRVIDADAQARCKSGETALDWNQQGPTGVPVLTLPNGVPVTGKCHSASTHDITITVGTFSSGSLYDASGTAALSLNSTGSRALLPVSQVDGPPIITEQNASQPAGLNVIVRDSSVAGSPFDRLDLAADGLTCKVVGTIVPGS